MADTSTRTTLDITSLGRNSEDVGADGVLTKGSSGFAEWAAPAGGPQPGAVRVLGPFPFAFGDAGLADGKTLYTPTIGDFLLDAWLELDEQWDAEIAYADIGTFATGNDGFFKTTLTVNQSITHPAIPVGLTGNPDNDGWLGSLVSGNVLSTLTQYLALANVASSGIDTSGATALLNDGDGSPYSSRGDRLLPGRFSTAAPMKVVVSVDGTKGGTPVAATAGSGKVYLVIATPSLT